LRVSIHKVAPRTGKERLQTAKLLAPSRPGLKREYERERGSPDEAGEGRRQGILREASQKRGWLANELYSGAIFGRNLPRLVREVGGRRRAVKGKPKPPARAHRRSFRDSRMPTPLSVKILAHSKAGGRSSQKKGNAPGKQQF